jgi:hypothetical protein
MFVQRLLIVLCLVFLVGCGGGSSSVTAQQVLDQFTAAGLSVDSVEMNDVPSESPVPKSFKEQASFAISEVTPSGGQIFVCDTKKNCDAIYAYYDALKGLAGPYLYQSPSGTVVAQLNSGLTPDTAAKYETVIGSIK